MTDETELQADAVALENYTDRMLAALGEGFMANFIPRDAWTNGAQAIVNAATASKDQSPEGRQAAGAGALRVALNQTGQGGRVSDAQCHLGAAAVLAADAAWKVHHA